MGGKDNWPPIINSLAQIVNVELNTFIVLQKITVIFFLFLTFLTLFVNNMS